MKPYYNSKLSSSLPQFDDMEVEEDNPRKFSSPPDYHNGHGATIRSITISKETRPDGSIVRRKETILSNGKTVVEEHVIPMKTKTTTTSSSLSSSSLSMSSPNPGIRILPAPILPSEILPLYHHHRSPLKSYEHDVKKEHESLSSSLFSGIPFWMCLILLVVCLIIQAKLVYMLMTMMTTTSEGESYIIHIFHTAVRKVFVGSSTPHQWID